MGVKPFISKKNASKFDLIYRSNADPEAQPEREWIESNRQVGIGRPDAKRLAEQVHQSTVAEKRYPAGHPLAWLEESSQPALSEARRKEIIAFGFPDDGYDYLQHVRGGHSTPAPVPAAAPVGQEASSGASQAATDHRYGGPSVFLEAPDFEAPPEDYKAIDASNLTIHQAAVTEDDASLVGGGSSGFSRELYSVRKRHQQEVDEMEKLMRQFEGDEVEGDLLEDFVITATEAVNTETSALKATSGNGEQQQQKKPYVAVARETAPTVAPHDSDSEADTGTEYSTDEEDGESEGGRPAPSESRSFASTYWRPERNDRKGNLSVIDERFEQLVLEYDSDEIGELDEIEVDPAVSQSVAHTDRFARIMDNFLQVHNTQDHAHDSGHEYRSAADTSRPDGEATLAPGHLSRSVATEADREMAAAAVQAAKEHVRRLESEAQQAGSGRDEDSDADLLEDDEPREVWDCESVLTGRTSLYNHPTRLGQMPRRRKERERVEEVPHTRGMPLMSREERKQMNEESGDADLQPQRPQRAFAPPRVKGETAEEKRARKAAVRDARAKKRAVNKEVKLMFKDAIQKERKQQRPSVSVTTFK